MQSVAYYICLLSVTKVNEVDIMYLVTLYMYTLFYTCKYDMLKAYLSLAVPSLHKYKTKV